MTFTLEAPQTLSQVTNSWRTRDDKYGKRHCIETYICIYIKKNIYIVCRIMTMRDCSSTESAKVYTNGE